MKILSQFINVDNNDIMPVVGIEDDKIIGSCNVWLEDDCAWLRDLFVEYDKRKQGNATELIKYCIDMSRKCGKYSLSMTVYKDNTDALRLYHKLGFQIVYDYGKGDNKYMVSMPLPENVIFTNSQKPSQKAG